MLPYQNSKLSVEERVKDLLSHMTLEEKILQTDQYYIYDFCEQDGGLVTELNLDQLDNLLKGNSVGSIQLRMANSSIANQIQHYAIEKTRLGIPFLFSEEALHGLYDSRATIFPQQIALASTFEPDLGYKMGRCIATEARAHGIHETYSPVMDLTLDPRYGRVEESYGEDVHLCSEFAREVVKGLQGNSLKANNTVAAEPKHYVGYGIPIGGLNCAPTAMGRHDVFAYCLPIFEEAFVKGGAVNAMCAYNTIDGTPVSMDYELLTTVLRDKFNMPGFVRSDLTAVSRLYGSHYITPSKEEAMRLGLEAGVDLQLYDFPHEEWKNGIANLINSGQMKEQTLDIACGRVLKVKFMLGLFENPYVDETLETEATHCKQHQQIAQQIAEKSICLLKNDNILPLNSNYKKIAVLGAAANVPMLGDYTPQPQSAITALEGIRKIAPQNTEIIYEQGCSFKGESIITMNPDWLISEAGSRGLTGRYYNGTEITGEPVAVRDDSYIEFNWIYVKPHPNIDASAFCVRWTGTLIPKESFNGAIGFSSLDSMRLYIDGNLIIDGWGEGKYSDIMVDFIFEEGRKYQIQIDYRNDMRGARVIFGYRKQICDEAKAIEAARQSDVAIVCIGENEELCGENFDRAEIGLPLNQLAFLKKVYETGTPVVLVLFNGRPLALSWEQDNIQAIIEAWYPGECGGLAIARILFGQISPSGRLPMSFPRTLGQIPCHYSRLPGGGRRYVETDWTPLYPFGYGLTYTNFEYSNLQLSANTIKAGDCLTVSFNITNTGTYIAEEVAQVYIRDKFSSVVKPQRELAGFTKVSLNPKETKQVSICIEPKRMRTLGADFVWRIEAGDFDLMVGNNSANIIMKETFKVI